VKITSKKRCKRNENFEDHKNEYRKRSKGLKLKIRKVGERSE